MLPTVQTSSPTSQPDWNNLPDDALQNILRHLDGNDLRAVSQVSQTWHNASKLGAAEETARLFIEAREN